ncbi:hypothetical protein ACXIUT_25755 [Achromobacter denitrificans]|jgi:hypothetical protein|uniref:hypothetical protein n=1 Tax=Achromobacter sp. 2789STDY5608633 TaxID=1806501 RepID=UPI0012E26242|nr:hypothetical protein [Achromobacter sp. 2789STDY5608633]
MAITHTRMATPIERVKAQRLRDLLRSGGSVIDAHCAKECAGVILIEPMNGSPYVVDMSASDDAVTVYEFEATPANSGTAHLRQRIDADLHYQSLVAEANRRVQAEQTDRAPLSRPRG